MKCEFEEKQFETALNHALTADYDLIYAAGQVLENKLGFDAAIFTKNPKFWPLFPAGTPLAGVELRQAWWSGMNAEIDYFPRIKFNVFIQHKRPTFYKKPSLPEWAHWQREFYKYNLTIHQQKTLEGLAQNVKNSGLVIYASPAFHKTAALWKAINSRTLIGETNFAEVGSLKNHSSYSYVSGGTNGVAHSEPKFIRNPPITEMFGRMRERKHELATNKETIIKWGNTIETVAVRMSPFSRTYSQIVGEMIKGIEGDDLAIAFYRLEAFCFVTGTDCFFGIDKS